MHIVINKTMINEGHNINEYSTVFDTKTQAEKYMESCQQINLELAINNEYEIIEVDVFSLLNQTEMIKRYLNRWQEQLGYDGCNSKGMVRNDIQYLLNNIKTVEVSL